MNIIKVSILLLTVFYASCYNKGIYPKTSIALTSFRKATLDTGSALTLLQVLKVYPMQNNCSDNEKYDNLYICEKLSNGDTVYVFEECQKVDKYAVDTSFHFTAVIDSTDLTKANPTKVTVFVPADFKMPTDAKYIFGNLGWQTEY